MRRPRDLDAELQALSERARALKTRRTAQLGELVIAAGADLLDAETLMGALLAPAAAGEQQAGVRAAWKAKGAAQARALARALASTGRLARKALAMRRREGLGHATARAHPPPDRAGGFIQKSGLVALTGDDRAPILGGLLFLADILASEEAKASSDLFFRRGRHAMIGTPAGRQPIAGPALCIWCDAT